MPSTKYRPSDKYPCTKEEMGKFIREKQLKVLGFRNPAPGEYMIQPGWKSLSIFQCPIDYHWAGDDPYIIVEQPRGV